LLLIGTTCVKVLDLPRLVELGIADLFLAYWDESISGNGVINNVL